MLYRVDLDYGKGMTKLMDFDTSNPSAELDMPAGELLVQLLGVCPTGIRLEINAVDKRTN